MSSSHSALQKYERALNRYFQRPAAERETGDREKILKTLGVENPQEFLGMHIPLWEAKLDELLDPTSTDMLPISISHSYVNWVRGAIRMMPAEARVKIFSSKFKATGLKKAILTLLHEVTGKPHRDFEVTEVLLIEKVHKDTLFTVRTPDGKECDLYLSRFGCIGRTHLQRPAEAGGAARPPDRLPRDAAGRGGAPQAEGGGDQHLPRRFGDPLPDHPRRRVVGGRARPDRTPSGIVSERHCGTGTTSPPRRGKW